MIIVLIIEQAYPALPNESIFVGDGGSNELYGTKIAGMKTIFTEYLETKRQNQKERITTNADYHMNFFDEILPAAFMVSL